MNMVVVKGEAENLWGVERPNTLEICFGWGARWGLLGDDGVCMMGVCLFWGVVVVGGRGSVADHHGGEGSGRNMSCLRGVWMREGGLCVWD